MDYRIKRQIGAWVGGAILALVIVLAARDAHAADIRPRDASALLLAQFDTVSDACLSAPLTAGGKYSQRCVERNRIARALERAGYERSRHDVWFRSVDVDALFVMGNRAAATRAVDAALSQLLTDLRLYGMPEVVLLAIWQQHASEFCDRDPATWALISELAHRIGLSHPHDPRFMLD